MKIEVTQIEGRPGMAIVTVSPPSSDEVTDTTYWVNGVEVPAKSWPLDLSSVFPKPFGAVPLAGHHHDFTVFHWRTWNEDEMRCYADEVPTGSVRWVVMGR